MALMVKNPPANAVDLSDMGSILDGEDFPGGGNVTPLQYSCWENVMDREALWATVDGVTKSQSIWEAKVMLKRKNKAAGISCLDFKQSHANQNSIILSEKQLHRSMEQN